MLKSTDGFVPPKPKPETVAQLVEQRDCTCWSWVQIPPVSPTYILTSEISTAAVRCVWDAEVVSSILTSPTNNVRTNMILQLNPPIPVTTPKGAALAHVLIDYGPEHNLIWVCFNDSNGECWSWSNSDIRIQKNITLGRIF